MSTPRPTRKQLIEAVADWRECFGERIARVEELKKENAALSAQLAAKDEELAALRAQLDGARLARTSPARISPIRKTG